jgi:hypothetical protein
MIGAPSALHSPPSSYADPTGRAGCKGAMLIIRVYVTVGAFRHPPRERMARTDHKGFEASQNGLIWDIRLRQRSLSPDVTGLRRGLCDRVVAWIPRPRMRHSAAPEAR